MFLTPIKDDSYRYPKGYFENLLPVYQGVFMLSKDLENVIFYWVEKKNLYDKLFLSSLWLITQSAVYVTYLIQ